MTTTLRLVRRRSRHDLAQLLTLIALVAVSTMLGIVGPGLVLNTLDKGAQDAVATAGTNADVVVSATVGVPAAGANVTTPDGMIALARDIPLNVPSALGSVVSGSTLTVISDEATVRFVDGEPSTGSGSLSLRIAMLTEQNSSQVDLVAGRLPAERKPDDFAPVEVVMSTAAADAAGLELGSLLRVAGPPGENAAKNPEPAVVIVGLVDVAGQQQWIDTPDVSQPFLRTETGGSQPTTRFTVLTNVDGVSAAVNILENPFRGIVRLHVDPQKFTAELATSAAEDALSVTGNGRILTGDSTVGVTVLSALPAALATYPVQARAALAQMSVMMAGVIGIAAVVLVLLSRLLVMQRGAALALERARGASVLSVGARALAESAVVAVLGSALGILIAVIVLGSAVRDALPAVVIFLVALLAGPVQACILARQLWTGRREPANRRDRQLQARRGKTQRVVIEVAIAALAAAALVSLRGRGLLQNRSGGIDPLLALAPLLLAIAITVIVIRVYPLPVRAIGSIARRTRGPLGLLGAVRARAAIAALPLLALTLGAALAVSGAALVNTVRDGQAGAAWQRVGASARISAELDDADVAALRAAPGVEAVSATRSRGGVGLDFGTTTTTLRVIGIDESYPDIVDAVPGTASTTALRLLESAPRVAGSLAIVVDRETARQLISDDLFMYYGPKYIAIHVVGTTDYAPTGYEEGPFAFVDLTALSAELPDSFAANTYLVLGPGTDTAVAALPVAADDVLTRTEWIDDRRGKALVSGVESTMIFAVAAVGLLAIVALVATVVSGARSRGRALSMLRTLGMSSRLGWWLALAELAPLVIAAALGGIAAGAIVVNALAPSLGLDVLAGGTSIPPAVFSPTVIYGLGAAAIVLLLIGALADVLVHRRDKLSEVLRVGETV